jgi:hypothetical protein
MNSELPERASDALKLRELVHAACEIEGTARASFLDRSCVGRPDLRSAMEKLLRADFEAEPATLWQRSAIDAEAREIAAEASLPFENLGPYRIVGRVGAGGMGTVHLAWRDYDDIRRQMAIKVVPRALLDDEMVRRFRQERQILAGLEHPNIARMLYAGPTPDGMPYLVMEYVDGVPLDRYAASSGLSAAARLALFGRPAMRCLRASQSYRASRPRTEQGFTASGTSSFAGARIGKMPATS